MGWWIDGIGQNVYMYILRTLGDDAHLEVSSYKEFATHLGSAERDGLLWPG